MADLELLIKKCQDGDTEAFGEIYEQFSERIFRFIKLKVQNKPQAEDILQDTFVKAWRGLPNFSSQKGDFSAWLYTIAGNTINDYFRKIYRAPESLELDENINIASFHSPLKDAIMASDSFELTSAIKLLPTAYRQVLELRFIQDFSISETAKILDKSNLAIRLSQFRALKQLKEIMRKNYDSEYSKI